MSDEMQKTMQFILDQQAQFSVNLQKVEERISRIEEGFAGLAQAQAELARAQAQMARSQTHMNEVVAVMADTHKHTEEKLDAFIGVLERYISSGRGSGSQANGET